MLAAKHKYIKTMEFLFPYFDTDKLYFVYFSSTA